MMRDSICWLVVAVDRIVAAPAKCYCQKPNLVARKSRKIGYWPASRRHGLGPANWGERLVGVGLFVWHRAEWADSLASAVEFWKREINAGHGCRYRSDGNLRLSARFAVSLFEDPQEFCDCWFLLKANGNVNIMVWYRNAGITKIYWWTSGWIGWFTLLGVKRWKSH